MVVSLFGATLIVFFMLHLTGDPTNLILPDDATAEERAEFRERMGFDRPLIVQYANFLVGIFQGDFGYSYRYQQPALGIVLERVPATAELMVAAVILILLISVPIAMLSVMTKSRWIQGLYVGITLIGQGVPGFVLAINMILLFSVTLQWLPATGNSEGIRSLIMPTIVLALFGAPQAVRLLRTSLASVSDQAFVQTALAKGQTRAKVMVFHIFRNALIPFITILGVQVGVLLAGAVITETVFGWPGMGQLMVQAINNRDYPVVQAGVLLSAFLILSINLVVDLMYAVIDPRIRY